MSTFVDVARLVLSEMPEEHLASTPFPSVVLTGRWLRSSSRMPAVRIYRSMARTVCWLS